MKAAQEAAQSKGQTLDVQDACRKERTPCQQEEPEAECEPAERAAGTDNMQGIHRFRETIDPQAARSIVLQHSDAPEQIYQVGPTRPANALSSKSTILNPTQDTCDHGWQVSSFSLILPEIGNSNMSLCARPTLAS
jgi:hypothetical protein